MSKARVFISYSHRGKGPEWKAALLRALHVFDRHHLLDVWQDGRIRISSFWDDDIKQAMSNARLAVVLLTKESLESEYILSTEFPFLRERQRRDKLPVFPVICETCDWKAHDWLRATQAPNESNPLSQISVAAQDRVFRKLATDIAEELSRAVFVELPQPDQPPPPDRIYLEKFPRTRSSAQHEEKLIGREQELALLDLAFAQPHTAIVSLVAWGGVGKTMLVQHWLQRLKREGWFGARHVYAWSFYSQGTKEDRQASEDAFLAHALAWFDVQCEPTLSPWDKGRLLADAVASERTLLILDGIEPLQHPPGPMGGQLRAPGVQSLLKQLARKANDTEQRGLCLVTTREPLTDLADFQRREGSPWGSVLRVDLGNLTDEAGAALLHHAGASRAGAAEIKPDDEELFAASREVDGHALTLSLLGRFLARAHVGDIRRRDLVKFEESDRKEQGGTTFKMLSAFEKWFAKGGEFGARRLTVMRLLGLFDRPADSGCIAALRNPPVITGLTDALFVLTSPPGESQSTQPLANEDWDEIISFLVDFGLVEVQPQETQMIKGFSWARSMTCSIVKHGGGPNISLTGPPEVLDMLRKGVSMLSDQPDESVSWPPVNNATAVALDTHPLIREYFGTSLRNSCREAWDEAHGRLYEFLKESVPHWPQGIEAVQLLVHAVSHGAKGGRYDDAYQNVYEQRLLRGPVCYLTKLLGAFQTALVAITVFFQHPWTVLHAVHEESGPERIFNDTAFYLGAVGRLREAVEAMSIARMTAERRQNWKTASIAAGNLSQLRALLGDLATAVKDGETAVGLASRSQDMQQKMLNYVTLGSAFHLCGNRENAAHSFVQADQILTSNGYGTITGSLPGFWCCDLLGSRFERAAWCKTITSRPINIPPLSELTDIEKRARAAFVFGDEWAKTSRLNVALDHLTVGRIEIYHLVLFTEGKERTGKLETAQSKLHVAMSEFRQYHACEFLPFGLLTKAWLRFLEHDIPGAEADLDEAWDIAERGPMRLHMADIHLYRARLFFREKAYPWKSPQDDLAAAEKLINDCGYHRRDEELADAKEVILGG